MPRIRVVSPMPLSRGGQRQSDGPIMGRVDMGVVAVDIDGRRCAGHRVPVTMVGHYNAHEWVKMYFDGVEVETRDLPCIRSVSFVSEFKRDDVLFDFVIPKDVSRVRRRDLYQQFYLPGLGYF